MANATTLHRRAARLLPADLDTSALVLDDAGQRNLLSLLFALRRPCAGSVAFRLGPRAAAQWRQRTSAPLPAPDSLASDGSQREPHAGYRDWQTVRLPCLEAESGEPLHFAARVDGRGWVVVLPTQALVLYAWCAPAGGVR